MLRRCTTCSHFPPFGGPGELKLSVFLSSSQSRSRDWRVRLKDSRMIAGSAAKGCRGSANLCFLEKQTAFIYLKTASETDHYKWEYW
jgi:hypothetical protein